MDPDRKERKIISFEELNMLGRAVWLVGATAYVGKRVVRKIGRVAVESRKAFIESLSDDKHHNGPHRPADEC